MSKAKSISKVWQRRYAQINHFESMLVEEGLTVLKFILHIDRAEQKKRLQARLDEPHKRWKFNEGDLKGCIIRRLQRDWPRSSFIERPGD